MCGRPASPGTGAPASATDPASAHASASGTSRGSRAESAGASSSYPVSESSGKTTTRAAAAGTAGGVCHGVLTHDVPARTAAERPPPEAAPACVPPDQTQTARPIRPHRLLFHSRTEFSVGCMSIPHLRIV